MCGIVGYFGSDNAKGIVLEGLKKLEYRGYDSAGICLFDGPKNTFNLHKVNGRIETLEQKVNLADSNFAIGHTRWATHGKVTVENAHPHESADGRFVLVHNGVIENQRNLKALYLKDFPFKSETDSEILLELIALHAKQMPIIDAIRQVLKQVDGSYALLIIDKLDPNTLYAAKNKSPLLIGKNKNGITVGSDISVMHKTSDQYLPLEDETIVRTSHDHFTIYDLDGGVLPYKMDDVDFDEEDSDKGEFSHYMMKEIHEQPSVIRNIISQYFNQDDEVVLNKALIDDIRSHDRIHIIAAGTSMHAGLVGKQLLESFAEIPTEIHIASEFAYQKPLLGNNPFFILISQSGETADLRACLVNIKEENYKSLTITNVKSSTLAREASYYLEIFAGKEIAVASTKAYTAQIATLAILAYSMSDQMFDLKRELSEISLAMDEFLHEHESFKSIVSNLLTKPNCFYIGRGIDYFVGLEAALKLKEISYIQTEGFAAGELKHGTIALIEEDTPVIAIISNDKTAPNTKSNLEEVKSRGANTLSIVFESLKDGNDSEVVLKNVNPLLSPLLTVIPTQLIAFYAALNRNLDIDKPRNLAKSVTVE